eukprot:6860956-Pyramimonas_sp.AAC.2
MNAQAASLQAARVPRKLRVDGGSRVDSLPHRVDSRPHRVDSLPHRVNSLPHRVDSLPHRVDSLPHGVDSLPRTHLSQRQEEGVLDPALRKPAPRQLSEISRENDQSHAARTTRGRRERTDWTG